MQRASGWPPGSSQGAVGARGLQPHGAVGRQVDQAPDPLGGQLSHAGDDRSADAVADEDGTGAPLEGLERVHHRRGTIVEADRWRQPGGPGLTGAGRHAPSARRCARRHAPTRTSCSRAGGPRGPGHRSRGAAWWPREHGALQETPAVHRLLRDSGGDAAWARVSSSRARRRSSSEICRSMSASFS
jgi:hypothetical protein